MKREFSAGGIVFRKYKVQSQKYEVMWLVVQHSQHKGWVFPKGLIGDTRENESKEETAVREVREEGGINTTIIKELPEPVKFFYMFKGTKVFKTVYFFLMEYVSGDIADHDFEVSDTLWLTEQEAMIKLTYKNDRNAFSQALAIFKCLKIDS